MDVKNSIPVIKINRHISSVLIFNDPHFTPKPPSFRTSIPGEWLAIIKAKLDMLTKTIKDNEIDTLICTGDWFDTPNIGSQNTFELYNLVASWLRLIKQEVNCILSPIGNTHDVFGNDISFEGIQKTALGALHKEDLVTIVPESKFWICEGHKVRILVCNYDDKPDLNELYSINKEHKFDFIIAHWMITPAPFFGNYILADTIKINIPLFCGHYHVPFQKGNIYNCGALFRLTEDISNNRLPGVWLVKFGGKGGMLITEHILNGADKLNIVKIQDVSSKAENNIIDILKDLKFASIDVKDVIVNVGKKNNYSDKIIKSAIERLQLPAGLACGLVTGESY